MKPVRFSCLPFTAISTAEWYAVTALRIEVFVVEQNCPYQDADGKDFAAWHLMGYAPDGRLACYARLLPAGVSYAEFASIGRVVSAPFARGTGAGRLLMEEGLRFCKLLFPESPVKISAQTYLLRFYGQLGFQSTGLEYLEDGIPHTEMLLT